MVSSVSFHVKVLEAKYKIFSAHLFHQVQYFLLFVVSLVGNKPSQETMSVPKTSIYTDNQEVQTLCGEGGNVLEEGFKD